METTNYCVCCNKPTVLKGFCGRCRRRIPSGFNVPGNVEQKERYRILLEEIERNERAKAKFQKTISLGALELDTCNNMFHIDNAYYKVSDVTEYSFYTGEPRYQHGLFGVYQVYADIYFAYRIKGRARCTRRLKTVQLHIEQTESSLWVDPSVEMLNIKSNFVEMIEEEQKRQAAGLKQGKVLTELKESAPELYDKLMSAYPMLGASAEYEKSISVIEEDLGSVRMKLRKPKKKEQF